MKKERTLVVIKPDGIQRSFVGEIIQRLERVGFKLVSIKMVAVKPEFIEQHYLVNPNWKIEVGQKNLQSYQKSNQNRLEKQLKRWVSSFLKN